MGAVELRDRIVKSESGEGTLKRKDGAGVCPI